MLYFNRYDICQAYYCYAYNYHQGQFSKAYKIFGRLDRIGYKPALSDWDENNLDLNARSIYDRLVEINY